MFGTNLRSKAFRRGQIAVALILVIIPLLALIGLGTDLGLLFFHWGIVQKAADSAVLAGAGYLPNQLSTAQTKATSYATQNGLKNSEIISNTVAADHMSITMTTSRTVPYYFLQLVGLSSGTVKPMAKAGIQQDTVYGHTLPLHSRNGISTGAGRRERQQRGELERRPR
jgi:uncharacterized membrane protein